MEVEKKQGNKGYALVDELELKQVVLDTKWREVGKTDQGKMVGHLRNLTILVKKRLRITEYSEKGYRLWRKRQSP